MISIHPWLYLPIGMLNPFS